MDIDNLADVVGIKKEQVDRKKFKKIVIKKALDLGLIKKTGRYFVKSCFGIDEHKLLSILGKYGITVEPEYDILEIKKITNDKSLLCRKIKDQVELLGGKFDMQKFLKNVKSENETKALEEYFND